MSDLSEFQLAMDMAVDMTVAVGGEAAVAAIATPTTTPTGTSDIETNTHLVESSYSLLFLIISPSCHPNDLAIIIAFGLYFIFLLITPLYFAEKLAS